MPAPKPTPSWIITATRLRGEGATWEQTADSVGEPASKVRYWLERSSRLQGAKTSNTTPMVIFVQAIVGGPIFIGASEGTRATLRRLQAGNPRRLRVTRRISSDTLQDAERRAKELQAEFGGDHLEGNWFTPTPELCAEGKAKAPEYRWDHAKAMVLDAYRCGYADAVAELPCRPRVR
jgi:hypothetical protein